MAVAFDVIRRLYREYTDEFHEGDAYKVTGSSSTTTVVCSALTEADDYWNEGVIGIWYDAGGASAAPEKEARDISDFTASSDTVTVGTAFSASPASGDMFWIVPKCFSIRTAYWALNAAIQWYGMIPQEDEGNTTTAVNTIEYTLPTAVNENAVKEVWIASNTSSPYDFYQLDHWHVEYEARKLIFEQQPPAPYILKYVFDAYPTEITTSTATWPAAYDIETCIAYAKYFLKTREGMAPGGQGVQTRDWVNFWRQEAERLKQEHPLPSVQRRPKYAYWPESKGAVDLSKGPNTVHMGYG